MAKRQIRDYVFLPGVSGLGKLKVLDKISQDQFLLITNTTDNQILYSFSDDSKQVLVSFIETSDGSDPDFPYANTLSNGVTTVTFLYDTTQYSSTDKIQIFIEEEEIRTRPYDFGTDAIERQRFSAAQSMIDADFEYGIQPTKWQSIDLMRGYPATYEQPGSDINVAAISTDASNATASIGPSLISVTTENDHGLAIGDPITLKGLNDAVTGFAKAEGSFVITTIPDSKQFTYYAKARVGTSPATSLFATGVQLRKAGFYTGAAIGSPTFTVHSNGVSGQVSTRGITLSNSDRIGLQSGGNLPPLNTPLSGTGIAAGTQVSGYVDTEATVNITSSFVAPTSIISVNDVSGISVGSAVDNGAGTTVFVTNILGNDITLSSPYITSKVGNSFVSTPTSASALNFGKGGGARFNVSRLKGAYTSISINTINNYNNISGLYSGSGINATFTVERTGGASPSYSNVFIANSGNNYSIGDTINLVGTSLGGTTPANDLIVTITGITAQGGITTFTRVGTASSSLPKAGTDYSIGEQIAIYGNLLGGSSPANDLTIIVTNVGPVGNILSWTALGSGVSSSRNYQSLEGASTGVGINSTFNVERIGTGSTVAQVNKITIGGTIEQDDVFNVTINGTLFTHNASVGQTQLGVRNSLLALINATATAVYVTAGENSNELLITSTNPGTAFTISISTTEGGGGTADTQTFILSLVTANVSTTTSSTYNVIVSNPGSGYQPNDTVTIVGSLLGGQNNVNNLVITVTSVNAQGAITAFSIAGTAWNGNASFENVSPNSKAFNATFLPRISGGSYAPTISNPGIGYNLGYQFKIIGILLGGTTPVNDLTITVTNINGLTGAITEISASGVPIAGDSLAFYRSISLTTPTSSQLNTASTLSYTAIAKIKVTFGSNHGLVPGDSILASVNSSGTNHALVGGPFYVEQVPLLTELIYTARATGTIATSPIITGAIYARPDNFYVHRPFDGGVQLGTGGPAHGAQAVRQSKKYVRYQSGKGIMYTTGALFAPSYDIRSATASGTSFGSVITVITDDVDHGLQVGAEIQLSGITTVGYNNHYTVASVIDEIRFTVIALTSLGSTTAEFDIQPSVSLYKWKGATVRCGAFDDQNGIFFQYDGFNIAVGLRSSTYQIAGTVTAIPESNLISGINTKFTEQLTVGDRIVIRGMSHVVTKINNNTTMYVNPDYRGVSTASNVKSALTRDIIIPQSQWNIDRGDGTGKSGYDIKINKMQMIGFQYSWYGAGFIDWMLRGPSGNFIFLHRLKGNNRNTEAFMRSGNLPVRYEVLNEGPKSRLSSNISSAQTSLQLKDASLFPSNGGVVYVDNEIIRYTERQNNALTGLTRASSLQNYSAGAQRTFTAGITSSHTEGTGVLLISNTATPVISHWGSAYLTDGGFDEDRGYIFNYQANTVSISTTKNTIFLIRLSPSVSNAITGDLGDRELINRAQLLLQGLEITTQGGSTSQGVIIEGVLNPQNYPSDPANIQWFGLNTSGSGGQPSFAQIALGSTVIWKGSATPVVAQNTLNQGVTNYVVFQRSAITNIRIGWSISGTGVPGGTTVVNFFNYDSSRIYIQFSQAVNPGGANSSTYTFAPLVAALPGEQVFSFASAPGTRDALDLSPLKELTNTPIGGRGTFPNGPDVLAINAYLTSGAAFNATLVLRWGEAQA